VNWLTRMAAYLPWLILACALLALTIVVWLVLWLRRHRVPPEPPEAAAAAEAEEGSRGLVAAGASYPSALAAALPFELTASFVRAIRYLRSQTTGRQRLYQLPWFLLLGEAGAGKTTLLHAIGAAADDGQEEGAAAGTPEINAPITHQGLGWRFFDRGVVLDVPGDLLVRPDAVAAHERGWRGLLRLLNRYRPRRPLDGAVLVLPAHDFATASALDHAALIRKATRIGEKLGQLQRESGVCFPVYVLISKCDQIAGFQSFCQVLPPGRLREIFGWSSPYRSDTAFESAWVDEAFEQVAEALNRSQSELFVERLDAVDPATLYFFPGELLQMRDRLRTFLHQVFRATAYRESFHCRGLYFSGDRPAGTTAADPVAAEPASGALVRQVPEAGGYVPDHGLLGLQVPEAPPPARPVFLDDLFERKIFPEWGLAHLDHRALWVRRNGRLAAQNLALATALVLAIGLGWSAYRLERLQRQTMPVLEHVHHDMTDAGAHAGSEAALQEHASDFVRSVAGLGNGRFYSIFIPASWFSTLDRRIQAAIETGFETSVLQIALNGLEQRAQEVGQAPAPVTAPPVAAPAPPPAPAVSADPAVAADDALAADAAGAPAPPAVLPADVNLQQLPEFTALAQFTAQVGALEDNIARYQRVSAASHGDVADLQALMRYLDPADTGDYAVDGDEGYLAEALANSTSSPFPPALLAAARQRVHAEMISRVDDLLNAWYQDNPSLALVQNLQAKIDGMASASRFGDAQLAALQAALDQAEAMVRSPQAAWMASPDAIFDGPLRQVTLAPLERSAQLRDGLFYPASDLEAYVRDNATTDWQDLHDQLAAQQTAITGPLLQFSVNGVRLAPGVDNLRLPIVDLMSLSFMAGRPAGGLSTGAPAGNHLTWDPAPLQEAVDMVAAYNRYLNEGLLTAPASVRDAFRKVAVDHLTANLVSQINQAEVWVPDSSNTGADSDIATEIKSMQAAQPLLTELLGDFAQLGDNAIRTRLLAMAQTHIYTLLRQLDAELDADAPYDAGANLAAWDGGRAPALAAFGLQTPEDLSAYLAFERKNLQAMGSAAAPLVDFLQRSPAARSPAEAELAARWEALVEEVQAYNNKVPGNALSVLENYITTDLDKTTPATHCQPAPPAGAAPLSVNFFVNARARLRRAEYARCLAIDQDAAHGAYSALAELFNRTLAGKFPFAAPGPAGAVEADPSALAAFYRRLDQLQPNLQGSGAPPAAAAFLQQMEQLRPLWAAFLANQAQEPVPVFDVTPTFRVNRQRERGGNQIIAWTLRIGDQVFQSGAPALTGRWSLGQPIALTLQWAKDAAEVPAAPPGGAGQGPAVQGRTATFSFDDPWSLFSLLERQQAPAADFDNLVDVSPNTLAFTIPTAPAPLPAAAGAVTAGYPPPPTAVTAQATVFVRIAFMPPGKVGSLRVPVFPRQAPSWEGATRAINHSH
jgi:type VI secretion system protein ImpL